VNQRVVAPLLQHLHLLNGDRGLFGVAYALDLDMLSLVIGDRRRVGNGQDLVVCLRDENQFCALGNMVFVPAHLVAVGGTVRVTDPACLNCGFGGVTGIRENAKNEQGQE